jgi:hypothetical protein
MYIRTGYDLYLPGGLVSIYGRHYQEKRERADVDSIASLAIIRKAKCRF